MLVAHKYSIIKRIGGGEFGQVFAGKNERTGEIVAIKMESSSANQIRLLKHESTILNFLYSKLCRNIPPVYWFGTYGDTHIAMVLPYYTDEPLSSRSGSIEPIQFLKSAIQILREIHKNGVVHRDIKPANWMFRTGKTGEKEMILIDFGLATFLGTESVHEETKVHSNIIGTPKFASWFVHCGREYEKRDDLLSALYLAMWIHHGDQMWDSIVELESGDEEDDGIEIQLEPDYDKAKTHVDHPMNSWLKRAKSKANVARLCREMGDDRICRIADTLYSDDIKYSYRIFS